MIKLSIIVPIYDVEQYLRKCVDSLLNQDLDNYEIILVDDGSPDACPQICDEYAERAKSEELRGKSCSIKVVHRENGGLSAARNSGIEVAQGEYIMFVDSDDYIEPNVLSGLREQVEREQLDVSRFDFQNVRLRNERVSELGNEREYEVFQPYKHPHEVDKREDVVDGVTYLNERMGYNCYVTQFIIKREIVPLFTEGIHFEDVDWLPRMMLRAERVGSTQKVVYNYLLRQGSITNTQGNRQKIRKNIESEMHIIGQYDAYRKQYPDCKWLRSMQSSMAAGVLTVLAREFYDERKEYISRLREMHVFPLAITNQGKTYARRARIINVVGPNTYCMLLRLRALCKV